MNWVSLLLIVTNVIFSYQGFRDKEFFERYKFEVEKILIYKDYKRILTSGFLHVNWLHLLFNMFSLWVFSGALQSILGAAQFLLIYFAGLVGGNLLALRIHRGDSAYSVVGASGAICSVLFASIAIFPGQMISFFGLFALPSWLYGLLFTAFSIYGIRSRQNNVGHESHLGGALVGMLLVLLLHPRAFLENYIPILILTVPTILFIYFILTRPHALLVDNLFFKENKYNYSIDHLYNAERNKRQQEIDRILEKIHRKGMNSLTKKEKETLRENSQKNK
jgi:membrane associated rhomboid family serine protease